jgi:hypothetical protein
VKIENVSLSGKFLIKISVMVQDSGQVTYQYEESFSHTPLPDKILGRVGPADAVGFVLSANVRGREIQPHYRIIFKNAGPLGTKVIDVSNGGFSGFFPVQALNGNYRYTVILPGLGIRPDDPEIQMDASLLGLDRSPDAYEILATYTTERGFEVRYKKNGQDGPSSSAPLPVMVGDTLLWRLDAGAELADFEVVFDAPPRLPVELQDEEIEETNLIAGDIPDGGPKRKTKTRIERRLRPKDSLYSYKIFALGKKSDPLQLKQAD